MLVALAAGALAVSVSPARVSLVAPAARRIEMRNTGAQSVEVAVSRRPLDGRGGTAWLSVRPARVLLSAGARATVTVRAGVRTAGAGDHGVLLLLVGRPVAGAGVSVRLRLGVPVRVRMPGRLVHHLGIRGLALRRQRHSRDLLVSIANLGNVTEQLRGQVTVTIMRDGRVLSKLLPRRSRELFPRMRTLVTLRYRGRARGPVTAVVRARGRERRYSLRL
jgi:hypothetical protein